MTIHEATKNSPHRTPTPFPGNRRVFFGHQSVGSNILDGIRHVSPGTKILEHSVQGEDRDNFGFFHAHIGQNGNPTSKFDEFAAILRASSADYNIAMMKLCYVDISQSTNIQHLFRNYASVTDELQRANPRLQIVHLTVPLRSTRLGIRSRAKLLLRRSLGPIEDNIQRGAYNSLIRSEYGASRYFFDVARLEATRPGGGASFIKYRGQQVRTLYSGYSNDGGHLNAKGKHMIARELVGLIEKL